MTNIFLDDDCDDERRVVLIDWSIDWRDIDDDDFVFKENIDLKKKWQNLVINFVLWFERRFGFSTKQKKL